MTTYSDNRFFDVMLRKAKTFAEDPRWVIERKLENFCERFKPDISYDKRLQKAGVFTDIMDFVSKRPAESLPPELADLWFIYTTAKKKRPKIILEFGSGISTVVLAKVSFEVGGFLYSLDCHEGWANSTRECLPEYLRPYCQVIWSPVKEVNCFDTRTFCHTVIPEATPNFVYLDGPILTDEVQVASDLLFMEPGFPKKNCCLVIDGREKNMRFLLAHLKRRYHFEWRKDYFNSIFELFG